MDTRQKSGFIYLINSITGLIGAVWLLPADRVTLRNPHCPAAQHPPLQKTTGQHYLTYPDPPLLVPPSGLAHPGR